MASGALESPFAVFQAAASPSQLTSHIEKWSGIMELNHVSDASKAPGLPSSSFPLGCPRGTDPRSTESQSGTLPLC